MYSCYFSPNSLIDDFIRRIADLEESVRTSTLPVIVAGDFNAKAIERGSAVTERRASLLCEMASNLHLHVANVGGEIHLRPGQHRVSHRRDLRRRIPSGQDPKLAYARCAFVKRSSLRQLRANRPKLQFTAGHCARES